MTSPTNVRDAKSPGKSDPVRTYAKAYDDLVASSQLADADLRVWLAVEHFARGGDACHPTDEQLADRSGGRSVAAVQRALRRLESLGLIERRTSGGPRKVRDLIVRRGLIPDQGSAQGCAHPPSIPIRPLLKNEGDAAHFCGDHYAKMSNQLDKEEEEKEENLSLLPPLPPLTGEGVREIRGDGRERETENVRLGGRGELIEQRDRLRQRIVGVRRVFRDHGGRREADRLGAELAAIEARLATPAAESPAGPSGSPGPTG